MLVSVSLKGIVRWAKRLPSAEEILRTKDGGASDKELFDVNESKRPRAVAVAVALTSASSYV